VKRFGRREDQLEARLRARRREPGDAFVRSLEAGIEDAPRPRARRLAVVGILTAVALAAFGASGGLSYAAKAVIADDPPGNSAANANEGQGQGVGVNRRDTPSANQYAGKTTICHRTSSDSNEFVLISVSDNALPAHAAHGDTLAGPGGTCPGDPIPPQ
jgi:hypothetical protein